MKLPSLQSLGLSINRVFGRFPLQFAIAILSTSVWWFLIENSSEDVQLSMQLGKLLVIFNFMFTLLLSADLFSEANGFSITKKWWLRGLAILIGIGLYFMLHPFENKADLFRSFLLAFAFHLLVSFAPFINKFNINGFWQYNKIVFLRFLTAAFYAAVLYIGLAIALFAIDGLFNADIEPNMYMKLFALVSAGFTTIFFLAGMPEDISLLADNQSYPKGLKIFTQYVLIPLMTIYLAILLVYEVKIIIIWSLPKGIVSSLILGYSVFGILSLLLIHPIKDLPGNGWMRLFSRFFYLMMIPLVVLLILAIAKRTGSYGITEPRFVLMALALWLSGITIYFLFSKKQQINVIPISLCLLTLMLIYGPQSAFSVSKDSQIKRLSRLMGSKVKADIKERASVIRYLVDHHGLVALQSFTKVDLAVLEEKIQAKSIQKNNNDYQLKMQRVDTALALLKVDDVYQNRYDEQFHVISENRGLIDVRDYDAMFYMDNYTDSSKSFMGKKLVVTQKGGNRDGKYMSKIFVKLGGSKELEFNLIKLASEAYAGYKADKLVIAEHGVHLFPAKAMQFSGETTDCMVTLVITDITGTYREEERDFAFLSYKSYLLFKQKK